MSIEQLNSYFFVFTCCSAAAWFLKQGCPFMVLKGSFGSRWCFQCRLVWVKWIKSVKLEVVYLAMIFIQRSATYHQTWSSHALSMHTTSFSTFESCWKCIWAYTPIWRTEISKTIIAATTQYPFSNFLVEWCGSTLFTLHFLVLVASKIEIQIWHVSQQSKWDP